MTRVAKRLTWPKLWLAQTKVNGRSGAQANSAIRASTSRLACGSRLAVGSSSSSTSGCRAQARAKARRCCCPLDNWRPFCRATDNKPTRSKACSASTLAAAQDKPRARSSHKPSATLFKADRRNKCGLWNSMAWRTPGTCCTRPCVGGTSPCKVRSKVLLPEPLAPTKATRSPASMRKLTPAKATCAPSCTLTATRPICTALMAAPPGFCPRARVACCAARPTGAAPPPAH